MHVQPVAVGASGDVFYPCGVGEVPSDGLEHAALERLGRSPVQLLFQAAGIDCVASIMPWPIGDEYDLLPI